MFNFILILESAFCSLSSESIAAGSLIFYLTEMEETNIQNKFSQICIDLGFQDEAFQCLLMIKAVRSGEKVDDGWIENLYSSPLKAAKIVSNVSTEVSMKSLEETNKENYFLTPNSNSNVTQLVDSSLERKDKYFTVKKTLKKSRKNKDGIKTTTKY